MVTIGGERVHARTGESVTYQTDLDHGPESTYYAARVLLQDATWDELDGESLPVRIRTRARPKSMQAVLAQIDGLEHEALNRD